MPIITDYGIVEGSFPELEQEQPPEHCTGCGNVIDPSTCWCGDAIDEQGSSHDNHHPIPMGCECQEQ